VAQALLQALFNVTDTFWVGRGLGPDALAGVSTGGFAVWMVLALASLAATGLTAVASRRHGEGSGGRAARAAYQATVLALLLSVVVGAAGLWGLDLLFDVMATPPAVTVEGAGYLAVYLSGVPVVFLYFVMDAAFRAAGDTRTPFRLLALAVALNLALDPLLILGWGPVPSLGIRGAAAATLVTRGVGCSLGFLLLARRGLIERDRPRRRVLGRVASIGLPVAASGFVFSLVYVVLTRFTSQFGTSALAALGVGHKLESLSYMVCLGFGVAAATSVGQNLGAGSPDRAGRSGETATAYATAAGALVAVVFLAWPEAVMGVFTDDPGVVRDGSAYLRIVAVAQLFMGLDLVLESAMSGAGYTILPMAASVLLTVARLPLAVGLSAVMGLAGIWWAISGTAVARGAAMAWIWRRGRWRKRTV
jgi:putative MATE family efflux protein